MDTIIRGIFIYLFIFIIFRLSGKRTLKEATPFDMVLLLIISETTQEALIDGDYSITNCFILIITLVTTDITLSLVKRKFKSLEKIMDGAAMILVENGEIHKEKMEKARIGSDDILQAARELQGLERMDQIKFAVLEKDGMITIIPKDK